MPTYTCSKCARTFKRKSGYDDHMRKKTDCVQNTALDTVIETKVKEAVRAIQTKDEITKENLPAFFEDLHHLLWYRAGLSPERALDHMTFFFAYRLIEQQADALNLPQECRWSYIASISNENDLFEAIKKGVNEFRKKSKTKAFFKQHEIQKADIVFEIVRHINRISLTTLSETDVLGDIFEYMLSRGMSTMADEGQYFTNRQLCKLAFKLAYGIKQTLRREDGSLCTFGDWFCGTGGFAGEFVKGVQTYVPDIDWKRELNSIYCQDMSLSSITTTLLNLLILTGVLFSNDTIRNSNSFSDPITIGNDAPFRGIGMDYLLMNPPYGGDKTKAKEYKFAYAKDVKGTDGRKTKKFFVNQDIQSIGIEDDDKVSAGVQLAMATLSANGGVCCIVLPQGFFFGTSKKAIELRKKIAEEYKIHYVVDIASGVFVNTGTKTAMLVFQRGVGPTETVKFLNTDETVLVEASISDLRDKNYSLSYKQYLAQDIVNLENMEVVKLQDIVTFVKEKSTKDKESYVYIDIGSVKRGELYVDDAIITSNLPGRAQYNVEIGDILIGTVRPNLEHYLQITPQIYKDNLIVSNGFSILRCNTNRVLSSYLYAIITLPSTTKYLTERATGTTYPVVDNTVIGTIEIPLPSLERQQQIVNGIDRWLQLVQQERNALATLEEQMMFEVGEMAHTYTRVKLKEICTFQRGTPLTKKNFNEGSIPVIGGGIKPIGLHDMHNREAYSILVSQSGTAGHISRYPTPVWASDCFSLHATDIILPDYLYYSVLHLRTAIESLKEGTAQPHIYPKTIEGLSIPVPPLAIQQAFQPDFDEIRHKHEKIAHYKAKVRDAIQRLIPGAT